MRSSVLSAALGILLVATACPNDTDGVLPGNNVLRVSAHEYGFEATDAQAGVLTIEATNSGGQLHHFLIGRLEAEATIDDIREWVDGGMEGPPTWLAEEVGGVEILEPDSTARLTTRLDQEGSYAFMCFIPDPQGTPHVQHGMYEVIELRGTSEVSFPASDHSFLVGDDALEGPEEVGSGTRVLEVRNQRDEQDQFFVLALRQDASLADVESWFAEGMEGPAPGRFLGGASLPAGATVYYEVELESGVTYTAVTDQDHTVEFTAA